MKKQKRQGKKLTTTQIALMAFVLVCVEILAYTEVVMYKLADLSALYVLIGIPVSLATALVGYFFKSSKENTEGGITYMTAQHSLNQEIAADPISHDPDFTVIDMDNAVG